MSEMTSEDLPEAQDTEEENPDAMVDGELEDELGLDLDSFEEIDPDEEADE